MNNLYLCSFMGCGKEMGQQLAITMGRQFLDLERFLNKKTKRIQLEEQDKERQMRKLEQQALEKIASMKNAIVFMGDRTFVLEENIILAKKSGLIIYLFYPFETCYRKIKGRNHHLQHYKNNKEQLMTQYNRQHTLYKIAANYIFDLTYCPKLRAIEIASLVTNQSN